MKATRYPFLLFLTVVLFTITLSSCTQGGDAVVPSSNTDVEGNIDVSAVSDDYSDLGNKIWLDENNDGIKQRAESGFGNVVVKLYKDVNKDGRPDGGVLMSDRTSSRGYYGFELLDPDINYVIEVVAPEGYAFSKKHASGAKNHDYDSDINPNSGFTDTIDVVKGKYFYWYDAALHVADSPANPSKVGNKVWLDENKDGIKQDSEPGVANVKLNLWLDSTGNGKPDKKLRSDITSSKGYYKFVGLDHSKSYFVEIELPDGYKLSQRHNPAAPNSDKDSDFYVNSKFTDKLQLVEGKYSYWLADAAIYNDSTPPPPPGETCKDPVYIPDSVLRAALKRAAGGNLTCDSLENVEILKANSKGSKIRDLRGIQFAKYMSKLYLNDNAIVDLSPLAKLRELEVLHLENNNIVNLAALAKLYNLESLNLAKNKISDISALEKLKNLNNLKLYGNTISSVQALRRMKDLEYLYLGYNSLALGNKVKDIATLKRLESLEVAELSHNYISNIAALLDLDELERVIVRVNCLDLKHSSDDYKNIQRLKAEGIRVSYGNQRSECSDNPPPPPDKPASVGDFIWEDLNKDGIYQNNEKGLKGIVLNLWLDTTGNGKPDKKVETTKTNDTGRHTFYNLDPKKSYYVELVLPNGYKLSQKHNPNAGSSNLDSDFDPSTGFTDKLILKADTFSANQADAGIYKDDVGPGKPASLGSKVWFDENRDGVKQRAENGIKGVKVSLFIDKNGDNIPDTMIKTQVTGERGTYEFKNLDPDKTYFVTIVLPGKYSKLHSDYGFTDFHSSDAPNAENLPGSDWDNDIDEKTGFSAPIKLVPGRFNYWAADIGLVKRSYHYTIRVFGQGYVNSSTSDYLCTSFGGKCYGENNDTLTAIAADGWEFAYWSGKGSRDENTYNVTGVNGDDYVRAIFIQPKDVQWKSEISGKPYWSPDGHKIAIISGADKGITILDAKSGKILEQFNDFYGYDLIWSKDSKRIAIITGDNTHHSTIIGIYNVNSGKLVKTIRGIGSIRDFAWSPDGTRFLVEESILRPGAHHSMTHIKIYNALTGSEVEEIANLGTSRHSSHTLRWSPDGKYLLVFSGSTWGVSRRLRVWKAESDDSYNLDFDSKEDLPEIDILRRGPVEWSPNSDAIFVFGTYRDDDEYQRLLKITVPDYQPISISKFVSKRTKYASLSPNRKYILIPSDSAETAPYTLEIRRVSDWQLLDEFVASQGGEVGTSDWSPPSNSIVVSGSQQTVMHVIKGIN